jgi:hypothetical protein
MAEVLSYFRSSSGSARSSSGKIKDCTYTNQPRVTVLGQGPPMMNISFQSSKLLIFLISITELPRRVDMALHI